ncbi:hypothetical protein KL911_005204 [Ogataea haglerorum]|uniref:uncharacterized protein n=1 Tax=Ogataea haglerorum TaxID=1937702 RepID=UPI001C89381D|nr:uncharacterized protein KL911_005204 [Ogataea haglerorum]KAG7749119.1 hypothetical protein KL911_005204 [Ogataea haglerorum]
MTDRLPRATLRQKIQVLDYLHRSPSRSQRETIEHFRKLGQFGISQATLSSWVLKEPALRAQLSSNPTLETYKRKPRLKYPDVTKAVEEEIDRYFAENETITDMQITNLFLKYMEQLGYPTKSFKLSKGWLHAFKKRNRIFNGRRLREWQPQPPETYGDSTSLDLNYEEIFNTQFVGFNTRLIHSDDHLTNFINSIPGLEQVSPHADHIETVDLQSPSSVPPPEPEKLPYYPTIQNPLQNQLSRKPYVLENFKYSKGSHPNSEKVEKILENITEGTPKANA